MRSPIVTLREAKFLDPDNRTRLERRWRGGSGRGRAAWLLCNPSGADDDVDDSTICRVIRLSERQGHSDASIVNLWPFVATDPSDLWAALDAGVFTDELRLANMLAIEAAAQDAETLYVAFGREPIERFRPHVRVAAEIFSRGGSREVLCFSAEEQTYPVHPSARGRSGIPRDRSPRRWKCPSAA